MAIPGKTARFNVVGIAAIVFFAYFAVTCLADMDVGKGKKSRQRNADMPEWKRRLGFENLESRLLFSVNQPPVVDAGPDHTAFVSQEVLLDATVTDDGAPLSPSVEQIAFDLDQQLGLTSTGNFFLNWGGLGEKWLPSDDGTWYFITPDGGLYASDGGSSLNTSELIASLDETYHADPNKLFDATVPLVPVIPAGFLTARWSKVSGPGEVQFADDLSVDTSARFSEVGTYVLRLEASDGEFTLHDELTVTVNADVEPQQDYVYVSDLTFAEAPTNGWGPVERDTSNGEQAAGDGNPITINGVTYAKGLGVHADSEVTLELDGRFSRFISDIGVDDEISVYGSVTFEIWGDGTKIYDSGLMTVDSDAQTVDVSVAGIDQLKLIVTDGGNHVWEDHANWADARLVKATEVQQQQGFYYVSDLPFAEAPVNGWGPVERDLSNGEQDAGDGDLITINGATYAKGLGVHADSEVTFDLAGRFSRFVSDIGVDDEISVYGSVTFEIWGDGTKIYDSGLLTVDSDAQTVDVSVAGVDQLKLIVTDGGNHVWEDHANWADARLFLVDGSQNRAPEVSAGPDQNVSISESVVFDGTVVDDQQPNLPGIVTTTWSLVSGPGSVTVDDTSAVDTTATFSHPGIYVLRLEAHDGELTASDTVTVTVINNEQEISGFFVSPTGSSNGDGSAESPWDLQTALSHPRTVKPGDTIWLRGGTYRGGFTSKLTGDQNNPIVVRSFPNETAKIDLYKPDIDIVRFDIYGGYTHFVELEITSSNPIPRVTTNPGSSTWGVDRGALSIYGDEIKMFNNLLHDTISGPGFWQDGTGGEFYGNIVYNNGWLGPDRGHGHGAYTQNIAGTKRFVDNIFFNQFGGGIQVYGNAEANLKGFHIEGNVVFNSGAAAGEGFRNTVQNLVIGGGTAAERITVIQNFGYSQPDANNGHGGYDIGYYWGQSNEDLVFSDNYLFGPTNFYKPWESIQSSGNTIIGSVGGDYAPSQGLNIITNPTGTKVFVRPNEYEAGRANVIVYNWDENLSVNVDLSSALTVGASYEVHHVYDLFGDPLVSGVYDGGTVEVPMKAISAPTLLGGLEGLGKPIVTGPEFGVFLVRTVSADAQPLQAAAGSAEGAPTNGQLTRETLAPIVDYAATQWRTSDLTMEQRNILDQVQVQIADLDGGRLGETTGTRITLDVNAAGHGWFIDTTPHQNEEFTGQTDAGRLARHGSLAAGRMDLLTVVMHELGHVLGYDHGSGGFDANYLMAETLHPGVRKSLDSRALDVIFADDLLWDDLLIP